MAEMQAQIERKRLGRSGCELCPPLPINTTQTAEVLARECRNFIGSVQDINSGLTDRVSVCQPTDIRKLDEHLEETHQIGGQALFGICFPSSLPRASISTICKERKREGGDKFMSQLWTDGS